MASQNQSDLRPEDDVPDNELSRLPTQVDLSVGEVPRPAFSNVYGQMDLTGAGLNTQAAITSEFWYLFALCDCALTIPRFQPTDE